MNFFRNLSLTENPNAEEGWFQEEGQQGFNSQEWAKDISNESTVLWPVHAELEFLHDARYYTDGKVDQEQFSPKLSHLVECLIFGLEIAGLHERDKPSQAKREWDEQKMIDSRKGELPSRKNKWIHSISFDMIF